ncbi:MAG TPA: hypothetical protein VN437_01480 [Rectinemataceae bacterium]|nr:hypothetical protein [Rectinemataceae bacterium]
MDKTELAMKILNRFGWFNGEMAFHAWALTKYQYMLECPIDSVIEGCALAGNSSRKEEHFHASK